MKIYLYLYKELRYEKQFIPTINQAIFPFRAWRIGWGFFCLYDKYNDNKDWNKERISVAKTKVQTI